MTAPDVGPADVGGGGMKHREAIEDGVRMGLGMAVQSLEGAASRLGTEAQKDALLGCAAGLREISAGFTLTDGVE